MARRVKSGGHESHFSSGVLNNPASMFGHTFLRIDQKGQTEQTRILAYTIDYAARVPPDVGLEYGFKGIFGGYEGYFSTPPYYIKVQAYRDMENRDMWEYQLNLTPTQIDRLLMHAWELGNAYFDYFFFKENCSYHIFPFWNMPIRHCISVISFISGPFPRIRFASWYRSPIWSSPRSIVHPAARLFGASVKS